MRTDIPILKAAFIVVSVLTVVGCQKKDLKVTVTNNSGFDRTEIVEIPLKDIKSRIGESSAYIVTNNVDTLISQITSDSTLIFLASVPSGESVEYALCASDTSPEYIAITKGRKYPERNDDLAWENDLIAMRVYGPATQRNGEKAYGYDIFFKYPEKGLVLDTLYSSQTSPRNWQIADSLQNIDPDKAEKWRNSFSYHVDHGLGMDCYAVGPTLGAGVAAIATSDSIFFPWCYNKAEIIDNGPLRFKALLSFTPVAKGTDTNVTEYREISLDAGSHFNRVGVWYEGLSDTVSIVVGIPKRDDSTPILDSDNRLIAYSDPTTGNDNGRGLMGIVSNSDMPMTPVERFGHILLEGKIAPNDTLKYFTGYAWTRADISDLESWRNYMTDFSITLQQPLEITY